ncbi:MAG: ion transporter [Gammaproteobacteria bacterium]|nr:ion transporter [Gammaproteobacteria bacterium]
MYNLIVVSKPLIKIVKSNTWTYFITILIIINTIILGMETYPSLMSSYGSLLGFLDQLILYIFIIELMIRLIAHGVNFFKDPWSLFDLFVVSIALIPSQGAFSALRAARALRILRLISIFPKLRGVIEGLVMAIPGIGAIAAVMGIIICVFGLMASKLYGTEFPQWFGNFHTSIFSLFQIMTLEGWPEIVRTVMQDKPYAWLFFISYILIGTFSVLNLFIAVIVEAMQRSSSDENEINLEKIDIIEEKLDRVLNIINEKKSNVIE